MDKTLTFQCLVYLHWKLRYITGKSRTYIRFINIICKYTPILCRVAEQTHTHSHTHVRQACTTSTYAYFIFFYSIPQPYILDNYLHSQRESYYNKVKCMHLNGNMCVRTHWPIFVVVVSICIAPQRLCRLDRWTIFILTCCSMRLCLKIKFLVKICESMKRI